MLRTIQKDQILVCQLRGMLPARTTHNTFGSVHPAWRKSAQPARRATSNHGIVQRMMSHNDVDLPGFQLLQPRQRQIAGNMMPQTMAIVPMQNAPQSTHMPLECNDIGSGVKAPLMAIMDDSQAIQSSQGSQSDTASQVAQTTPPPSTDSNIDQMMKVLGSNPLTIRQG